MNFNPIQGAHAHHMAQGNMLQGMAGDAMAAIQRENESRVAQSREMRRMQHEKEMEQMRINAMIQRLGQQAPPARPVDSGMMGLEYDPVANRWNRW